MVNKYPFIEIDAYGSISERPVLYTNHSIAQLIEH